MQSNIVMAFRKRLKKTGYEDISIKQMRGEGIPAGEYTVTAIEPLAGMKITAYYTLSAMHMAFKKKTGQQAFWYNPPPKNTYQQVNFFDLEGG